MPRSWFKCHLCARECDNSVAAEGYGDMPVCQPCADSYCPTCDSLYSQPTPTAGQGWTAHCPECGDRGFFTAEVARTIVELNHTMRKEAP